MKFGELKIECINELDEMNDHIDMDNLSSFENDESYFDLFARMPGSINRAMDRIANRKLIPAKQTLLNQMAHGKIGEFLVFDLSLIPDFRNFKRLSVRKSEGFIVLDEVREGNLLFVPAFYGDGDWIITLSYYPNAPAVSKNTANDAEIDLPDELARIIPYYVKSDLLDRQEPALAAAARNKFESALDEISLDEPDFVTKTIQKDYRI